MINFMQYISEISTDTFSSIIHNPLKAFFSFWQSISGHSVYKSCWYWTSMISLIGGRMMLNSHSSWSELKPQHASPVCRIQAGPLAWCLDHFDRGRFWLFLSPFARWWASEASLGGLRMRVSMRYLVGNVIPTTQLFPASVCWCKVSRSKLAGRFQWRLLPASSAR